MSDLMEKAVEEILEKLLTKDGVGRREKAKLLKGLATSVNPNLVRVKIEKLLKDEI